MASRKSVKKSTPSKKASSTYKYDYVELANASATKFELCDFYGVITDASFPYKKILKTGKATFVCVLKVVDPTLYGSKKDSNYAQVVINANTLQDLPFIHRIGDIIRIHRAELKFHNGKRQFSVNMTYNSSWALYSSDKLTPLGQTCTDAPFAYSGKKYTHETQDTKIQTTLKKWANQLFAAGNVVADDQVVSLKNASKKEEEDFDVVAKVLQVFELDEYTNELKLKDQSGETYYCLALKLKFPHLKAGAVVKIRSATHDVTSAKKVLILQHFSNIMTFISSSKLASTVSAKVSDDKTNEKAALKSKLAMTPVVLTEVDKKHSGLQTSTLHDLFHTPDASTSTFRVCFYVTKVEPGNHLEACKSYDKKSKKASSAKGSKGGDLIYQVQFLAKDNSTQFNNNVYRILLYTHEGLGANFLPQKAANLHSDSKAAGKVKDCFEQLTKFNSWVDAVVERRNGHYFIKDTKMIY